MMDVSVFADESGEFGTESKYYLLTLVFHDQSEDITRPIDIYKQALINKGLPDIAFHASPLMNGHDEYKNMDIQERKQLLSAFFAMLQHMPVLYKTFSYKKSEFETTGALMVRMRRDIVNFMFEHLAWFQQYDEVKVYYDDGQQDITQVLHDAAEYALSANAVLYRTSRSQDYRLSQAADLLCTLELTALKYEAKEQTSTDERFFGAFGSFKKNYLKKVYKKKI